MLRAQKPPIEFDTYKSWPGVSNGNLSPDGKYAFYIIDNLPLGGSTFNLVKTDGHIISSFSGLRDAKFSPDSRYLIGILSSDTLMKLNLLSMSKTLIPGISSFDLKQMGKETNLLYLDKDRTLHLQPLSNKRNFKIDSVVNYMVSKSGSVLLVQTQLGKERTCLKWISTKTFKTATVYTGSAASSLILNDMETQAAFIASNNGSNQIFYYQSGADSAVAISRRQSIGKDHMLKISAGRNWRFSNDGSRLFLTLQETSNQRLSTTDPDIEVWNYEDTYLGSYWYGKDGKSENIRPRDYLAAIHLKTFNVQQLTDGDDRILANTFQTKADSLVVVQRLFGDIEEFWNKKTRPSFFLLNTINGHRVPLEINCTYNISRWTVSESGKYIVYFDPNSKNLICYDTRLRRQTKLLIPDIEKLIPFNKLNYPLPFRSAVKFAGWDIKEENVFIYGTYDIWKIDISGRSKPVNITCGLGEQQQTVFLAIDESGKNPFYGKESLVITGMNRLTKDLGFYRISISEKPKITKLIDGPWYTGRMRDYYVPLNNTDIVGSVRSGYMISLQDKNKPSNFFYTKNFKSMLEVSNVQPQLQFNWLTTELLSYRDKDGNLLQGILYKPENFDPNKKYPLLVNIYESKTGLLNAFQSPAPPNADFNIPLLVSNGYLVLLPDIRGIIKNSGQGALQSVNAALDFLSDRKYIDTTRMGISGHSFGGFETNYIVTHSKRFAAALIGAGVTSIIADASSPWWDGAVKDAFILRDFPMMGDLLGEDPDTYVRNSPILSAKNVQTPILFMHNDSDGSVYPEQTRSMFMVLRSLGKPCWWINYRGRSHVLVEEKDRLDYEKRVADFFNHFLRGDKKPDWMNKPI